MRIRRAIIVASLALVAAVPSLAGQQAGQGARTRRVSAPSPVIWRSPGLIQRLDLAGGPGGRAGAPKPPFTFVEEDTGGTNPKIEVKDASGRTWGVKWGEEVNSEVFASRIAWAAGYFVEPTYYVPRGTIQGVTSLDRAKKFVGPDGSFSDARFELKEKGVTKLKDEESWRWEQNPFVGTKELSGLKIVMMLVSNWDSKDQEMAGKGSNTKIFMVPTKAGVEPRYVVSDWGGTMGKWGGFFRRAKWDCDGFASQSKDFIKGADKGYVEFGYSGQHTSAIKDQIPVEHVRWIAGILGKLTDAQIRSALAAAGATPSETECFTRAMRARITALGAF
jgi:hypothetical protein